MTMQKSSSIPALMKLGTAPPKGENHHRRCTMGRRHNSNVDFNNHSKNFTTAQDQLEGAQLAEMMAKPGWRLDANERPTTPTMLEDVLPKNMRGPRVQPAWLKHQKQVLRFYAFYQESVCERPDENSRYRTVAMKYMMEDGTFEISEPRVENSGIPQGAFLKRHQVPRSDGCGFVGPDDLRCGVDITIYSRTYHITGCDRFTRWFYEENGIEVGEDEPMVQDLWQKTYRFNKLAEKGGLPISRQCVDAKTLTKYAVGQPPPNKMNQWLLNDGKVLRFSAYWDDDTLYGMRMYFTIHFFLSDNSVEINEALCRNAGRDNYPVFKKRGLMYKENTTMACPGMLEPDKTPYMPDDFRVGEPIYFYNRKIVLYDCDEFTLKFYKDFMDIDQNEGKIDCTEPPIIHKKLKPPPHNGVGTEEHSLINCLMIQPKPPKQDLVRLMTLSGEVLRFEAKVVNGEPEDETRRMVISYYPADYQIMVCEVQLRNSGHMAGKFAKKERKKNPDTGRYFEMQDFFVGQTVIFSSQPMLIIRADEHALQYLEANCHEYPKSDPKLIAAKIAPLGAAVRSPSGIDPDHLKELAEQNGIDIVDHEIITLLRRFPLDAVQGAPMISGIDVLRTIGK